MKLLSFDFPIEDNPDRSNMVADALSRQMDTDNTYNLFSRRDKTETLLDPELQRLNQSVIAQPEIFLSTCIRMKSYSKVVKSCYLPIPS